jgi:hypothetical protein
MEVFKFGIADIALLSQEGSVIAEQSREGWFQSRQPSALTPMEPPRRFAPPLLTQEGSLCHSEFFLHVE